MNKWELHKFTYLVEINPRVNVNTQKQYEYIEMKDLTPGYKWVYPSDYRKLKGGARFKEGNTLFARITPCLENGKICQVKNLQQDIGFGSTEFLVFRNIDGISDKDFVYYLASSLLIRKFAENKMVGTSGRQRVNKDALENPEITPPPTQKRIAEILGALDDKIELNLQMNKTLEEMAMTLYKHWFVDFGLFHDGEFLESELGLIPKGWEVKSFFDIADLLSGGTPKTKISEFWNGDISWVSDVDISNSTNLFLIDTQKKLTQAGVDRSATKILPENTLIVVARGSVGKFAVIAKEMAMNQSCYGIHAKNSLYQNWLILAMITKINSLIRSSHGTVFDTVTTSTFKSLNFCFPPYEILEEFNYLIKKMIWLIKENTFENNSLANTRDYLLPKLISGEINIR